VRRIGEVGDCVTHVVVVRKKDAGLDRGPSGDFRPNWS